MCTAAYLALFGMQDVKAAQRAQRKRLLSEEAGLRIRRGMIRYLVGSAVLLGVPQLRRHLWQMSLGQHRTQSACATAVGCCNVIASPLI